MDDGETRACARCGAVKPIAEFPERKLGSGRRHTHCRACKAAYQKAWYEKNKRTHKANVTRLRRLRRRKNLAFVRRVKDQPCADCGQRYPPYVMDFDHVKGEKVANIARLVNVGTMEMLRLEIEKCDVVCANCHRQRTFSRLGMSRKRSPGRDSRQLALGL